MIGTLDQNKGVGGGQGEALGGSVDHELVFELVERP